MVPDCSTGGEDAEVAAERGGRGGGQAKGGDQGACVSVHGNSSSDMTQGKRKYAMLHVADGGVVHVDKEDMLQGDDLGAVGDSDAETFDPNMVDTDADQICVVDTGCSSL